MIASADVIREVVIVSIVGQECMDRHVKKNATSDARRAMVRAPLSALLVMTQPIYVVTHMASVNASASVATTRK